MLKIFASGNYSSCHCSFSVLWMAMALINGNYGLNDNDLLLYVNVVGIARGVMGKRSGICRLGSTR